MAIGRLLGCAGLLVFLAIGSGCTLYLPRSVTFRVRDGDTGQPIAGAQIKTSYLVLFDFGLPFASIGPREGVTDREGNLALVLDPCRGGFQMRVTADGYPDCPNGRATYGSPRWAQLVPGPRYSWRDEYHVFLYQGPRPTAEVTLPDGYRGVVLVRFSSEEPRAMGHKREFSYTASPRGAVAISDGAFFEAVGSYKDIRVRYAGQPAFPTHVPTEHGPDPIGTPPNNEIALRFVTPVWEQHTWLYVLGTAAEAEQVERSVWPDPNGHFNEAAFNRIVEFHAPAASPGTFESRAGER